MPKLSVNIEKVYLYVLNNNLIVKNTEFENAQYTFCTKR